MVTTPPIISIVGRKNSGKTTLLVALAARLKAGGLRIASLKHGHHAFEMDQPGRDTWRHVHEGGVEAVMMVSSGKMAMITRLDREPDPLELIRTHLSGGAYDLVLVEGYKHGPFDRIEVHRSGLHAEPLFDPRETPDLVALVTDSPEHRPGEHVVPLSTDGSHVRTLAELVLQLIGRRMDDEI